MAEIIRAEGLAKAYGAVQAVRGIDFAVEQGSLFSFLGVNGAGKSTTINILCSILKKDAGRVTVGGYDLDAQPGKIKPLLGIEYFTQPFFYGFTHRVVGIKLGLLGQITDFDAGHRQGFALDIGIHTGHDFKKSGFTCPI